jgi:hypothetical protein
MGNAADGPNKNRRGKEMTIRKRIQKAIEVLGAPVMSYAPEIAVKEYDRKIKEAVKLLLGALQ